MKQNNKENGILGILALILALLVILAIIDVRLFFGALALCLCVVAYIYFSNKFWGKEPFAAVLEKMVAGIKLGRGATAFDFMLPIVTVKKNGEVVFANQKFLEIAELPRIGGKFIDDIAKINLKELDKDSIISGFDTAIGDSSFKAYGTYFKADKKDSEYINFVFVDTSEINVLKKEAEDCAPVVSLVMIDNYDEFTASLSENEKGSLVSKIENIFLSYVKDSGGIFRSIDRNRYLFICQNRFMDEFIANKFDVLDNVRGIMTAGHIPVTISIGVGKAGSDFKENSDFAKQAIDMALGRGGDQAVIKTVHNFEFFGGKSKGTEKRSKVKTRVAATAIADLLDRCSNVLIMGHKYADFDSVGACVAIARAAFVKEKPVNIIINRDTVLAGPIIESLEALPEYQGVFISAGEGQDLITSRTLLFVCDTHSPSYVESRDILDNCGSVVVIDHHRKMAESIENTVQFCHEPFASSASEIASELIAYIDGNGTLLKEEAEAMLAGIILDTKNFYFRTGFRTFEAAAYLRRAGADLIELKRLFKSDYLTFNRKTELIGAAEFYRKNITISVWEGEKLGNAIVIMSQAADELLNIENVEASFVLYKSGADSVHISARSLGNVNVQIILEKLGGGGHLTTAGAQVEGDYADVIAKLKTVIDEYYENDDKKQQVSKTE